MVSGKSLMSFERLSIFAFVLVSGLILFDVAGDIAQGASISHVAVELIAFFVCAAVLMWQVLSARRVWRAQSYGMRERVDALEKERDAWQAKTKELLQGLSHAIDTQFDLWQLSAAEKEIGLLILKGLSHKEIAALRGSSERTVRQQAAAIYAKSGVEGKAALSAFFLEELLIPDAGS